MLGSWSTPQGIWDRATAGSAPLARCLQSARNSSLDGDREAVLRKLGLNLATSAEHVCAHVGQDEPFTSQTRALLSQRRIAQVIFDRPFEDVRLTDEHV